MFKKWANLIIGEGLHDLKIQIWLLWKIIRSGGKTRPGFQHMMIPAMSRGCHSAETCALQLTLVSTVPQCLVLSLAASLSSSSNIHEFGADGSSEPPSFLTNNAQASKTLAVPIFNKIQSAFISLYWGTCIYMLILMCVKTKTEILIYILEERMSLSF